MEKPRPSLWRLQLLAVAVLLDGCAGSMGSIEPATVAASQTSLSAQSGQAARSAQTDVRTAALTSEKPGMSDAFVDAIGADSHFYITTDPYVTQFATIAPLVVASGIRHLRDSNQGTAYAGRMSYFAAHGIKHSIGTTVTAKRAEIDDELTTFGSQVDFIEPANEWDAQHLVNPDWVAQIRANQALIFAATRANSATSTLTVLGPSIAWPVEYAKLGNLQSEENAGNIHNSTCDWNPGTDNYLSITSYDAYARESTPTKPLWTTETGYGDDMSVASCTLPDAVIAKYDPRTVTERWNAGQPRVYFYQLVDEPSDSLFGSTGLIDAAGKPKPQFTALQSLIGILSDRGGAFTTVPLSYALSGETANVDHTLLQRRDGSYELLLWLEVPAWDHDTRTAIAVKPQTITVTLLANPTSARQYVYDSAWKLQSRPVTFTNSALTLTVTDAITVLLLRDSPKRLPLACCSVTPKGANGV
jgi:hypothetical protein